MKKFLPLFLILVFVCGFGHSQTVKILFDATKAETAGNADWVIDADIFNLGWNTGPAVLNGGNEANAQRIPTPLQSTITASTAETYWTGALSSWGIDCVKKGYQVETLPSNGQITYNNSSNAQDLSNYKVFIVCEPNILFTATEKTAIMKFVQNGGSLFMVSDHTISDRNNDGQDSPAIWNDLINNNTIQVNPFGLQFDLANVSPASSNISSYASDSLLHGPMGNVTSVKWSNGTTITINTSVNISVKAAVYNTGVNNTGSTGVLVAYARFGLGKVVAIGDSSPCDDGTGDPNDALYNGYTLDAGGNHQRLLMNATIWLATNNTVLPVGFSGFTAYKKENIITLEWATAIEKNNSHFEIGRSGNGIEFTKLAEVKAAGISSGTPTTYHYTDSLPLQGINYYRIKQIDIDGNYTYSAAQRCLMDAPSDNMVLYPNPAKNEVTVRFNTNKTSYQINIFDSNGKWVKQVNVSSIRAMVNIADLPTGTYLLHLNDGTATKTSRFIKL